jgi:hypothetical protein
LKKFRKHIEKSKIKPLVGFLAMAGIKPKRKECSLSYKYGNPYDFF